jgi:hypothetical protein
MVSNQNLNLDIFWALEWIMFYGQLEHFTAIRYILYPFGTYCGRLVYFLPYGILCQEKYGIPERTVEESSISTLLLVKLA